MAEPFLSEIRLMSFQYAPKGWALCNGQLLPINQNQALFALLGTTYGGNGQTNFALPDLQGRVPMHVGSWHTLGERGGEQAHTLSVPEMPRHTHPDLASTLNGNTSSPAGAALAPVSGLYGSPTGTTSLGPTSVSVSGGGQAHQNMQPFLTISFCIALQGIFPSTN
ncbi:tail fiber protein [Nocardioides sp. 503]|uniref:phage tail protein n=1 Tax=Nocardioides sp. 503 TaxID=2508326 RepID=UPI00106F60E5|nr:tail fiber protein [Nocardioides sp. 503]